jgi:hypothetical protein
MQIIQAQLAHLEAVARLFNQYRMFYQQPSNLEGATQFLREHLQKK